MGIKALEDYKQNKDIRGWEIDDRAVMVEAAIEILS